MRYLLDVIKTGSTVKTRWGVLGISTAVIGFIALFSVYQVQQLVVDDHWKLLLYFVITLASIAFFFVALFKLASPSEQDQPPNSPMTTEFIRSPKLGIEVWQEGERNPLLRAEKDAIRVPMKQAPFEVRVARINQGGSLMIAGSYNESIFDSARDPAAEPPYFGGGTGLADWEFGGGVLALSKEAHNHLDWGGRLVPLEEGNGGKVLFHAIRDRDEGEGKGGLPQGREVFLVVALSQTVKERELFILAF